MQHPTKHACNIGQKTEKKHWEQNLATYVYNNYNICNIPIYFCNIHMKRLQHTSKTSKTLETNTCNIRFQAQHLLVLGRNRGSSTRSSTPLRSSVGREIPASKRLRNPGKRLHSSVELLCGCGPPWRVAPALEAAMSGGCAAPAVRDLG
jgi:hypothetical protein